MLPNWLPTPSRLAGFFLGAKFAVMSGGLPDIAIAFGGPLGDDLMCSVVACELKKRGTRKVWQLTELAELYIGNPYVIAVPPDQRIRRFCNIFGKHCHDLWYPHPPPMHLIATMCAAVGIQGQIELWPRIFLSNKEERAGKVVPREQITIQASSLGASWPVRNKQWPFERFQAVANALKHDFDLVQIGALSDPQLAGALDLRGKTTARQAAAVLSSSRIFIGLEGGLMHLARAAECRSVIVYGGRVLPSQTGYSGNENLQWEGACAPCWQRDTCNFDRICLQEISTEAVVSAAWRQIELYGKPLPVDRLSI
jgi:ADP-heptose:LPS heptosyltransferase